MGAPIACGLVAAWITYGFTGSVGWGWLAFFVVGWSIFNSMRPN